MKSTSVEQIEPEKYDLEGRPKARESRALIGVLAIALFTLLLNLNGWSVLEASEARYAEISREMFRSGDWLHPTLLNILHYHKPPVVFWLTSLGYQLFGVNAFGARFFLQISLIAQGALVYGITQRLFGERLFGDRKPFSPGESLGRNSTALFSTLIYLSFPLSIVGARNLTTDSFLTTLTLSVVYCMSAYYCQRQVWGIYGSAITIGLGFLTKGPAIFVVPFFFWIYLMVGRREDYRVPIKHLLMALVLCVGIGLSWYVCVSRQVPGLADYFVGRQVVARVSDDRAFDRAKPNWYYPLILVTTTLPWFFVYAASCFRPGYRLLNHKPARQLSIYWLLLPFIIFALSSSKLMLYLLPIYPGIAIALATLLPTIPTPDLKAFTKLFIGFYELLGCLLLFGVLIAQNLGADIVVTWPMISIALLVLLVPPIVYFLVQQPRLRLCAIAFFSMLTLTLYSSYFFQANELLLGGTRPLAQFVISQGLRDQPVVVYNKLLPSLAFNLDRDIITINDDENGGIARETQFQTGDQWRKYWVYSSRPESRAYLEEIARSPSTLIARGDIPESWNDLVESYPQSAKIGRWKIFYRQSQ